MHQISIMNRMDASTCHIYFSEAHQNDEECAAYALDHSQNIIIVFSHFGALGATEDLQEMLVEDFGDTRVHNKCPGCDYMENL